MLISLAAFAIPVAGAFLFPDALQDYEALLWLLALVPAFLLAYDRGWGGVATALAAGMALLSLTYAYVEATGRAVPSLLFAVVVAYLVLALGIGWLTERLRGRTGGAQSLSDPLTGLAGRGYAEFFLEKEFAAAERGRPLAIVLFGIDDADGYRQRHGDGMTDRAIRTIGEVLAQGTRKMNLSARYDTDRFLCILGVCDEEGAVTFSLRLQDLLREAGPLGDVALPTLSAGIAAYRPDTTGAAELISCAERARRQAVADGGDRVRVFGRGFSSRRGARFPEGATAAPAAHVTPRDERTPIGTGRLAFVFAADPGTRERLLRFLEREAFRVTAGSSLSDGVALLRRDYDLVFTDLGSTRPVLQLIREIRARSPATRILGILAIDGRDLVQDVVSTRVDGYFHPLIEPESMRDRLVELLDERDWILEASILNQQLAEELRATSRAAQEARKESEQAIRQSEEYFRALIENSADIIAVVNPDATIRYVSPAIERVLGRTPEGLFGGGAFDFVHPDDQPPAKELFARVLAEPGATRQTDIRARHEDGGWRVLEIAVSNLLNAPSVGGLVVNARDITDRRTAERALLESQELLARSQKMDAIGRLAGGVAHDFNNLLTAIQGHAELLLADLPADSPIQPDLREIAEAARRATALTRQLLAFSRKQVLQPRVLDINAVVGELEKILRRLIGEDVSLDIELDDDAGFCQIDPTQIEQVLINLAVNARDAMPQGGKLSIRTGSQRVTRNEAAARDLEPGVYVVVTVSDTGHGIEPDIIAKIFEPFFTTKEHGKGTGLGLSTAYGIVKQSAGHIQVDSRPGRGATFHVYLPRVPAAPARAAAETAELTVSPRGAESILLVEDETGVRNLALRVLRRGGYDVSVAPDGVEAVALIEQREAPFDLLLTDVVMPRMGGKELADRASAIMPRIRILFMSGYNEEAVAQHGVLTEGTHFLEKPFSPDVLLRKVRAALDEVDLSLRDVT